MVWFPQPGLDKSQTMEAAALRREPQLKCFGGLQVNNHQWVPEAVASRASSSQMPATHGTQEIDETVDVQASRHLDASQLSAADAVDVNQFSTWGLICLGQLAIAMPPAPSSSSTAPANPAQALAQLCRVRCKGMHLDFQVVEKTGAREEDGEQQSVAQPSIARKQRMRATEHEEDRVVSGNQGMSAWELTGAMLQHCGALVTRTGAILSGAQGVAASPGRIASDMLDRTQRISRQAFKIAQRATVQASQLVVAPFRWGMGSGGDGSTAGK